MSAESLPVFLTARWTHLLMLNYPIDPVHLEPLVPRGAELDTFEGKTFVSMVGFLFLDTRVRGIAVPFHRNFEEVNLRFYVRREIDRERRRGVVFVREIVPRRALAAVARALYNENYVAMPMRHHIEPPAEAGGPPQAISYRWHHHGRWSSLSGRPHGEAKLPGAGTEEEFITEHYWGYSRQRDGGTVEYRVTHPRWRVWQVTDTRLDCEVSALYGDAFRKTLESSPSSAFVAEGSDITVSRGHRLPRGEAP